MDMKRWLRLLRPPVWLLALLTVLSGGGLALVFLKGREQTLLAYGLYALSFYTLCALVLFCVERLPAYCRRIREKLLAAPGTRRLLTDRDYRDRASLHLSLTADLMYVGINLLSWYLQRSWWFVCLAVYYGIMSLMRYLLARYVRLRTLGADRRGELKGAMSCAWIMLLLDLFLSGAVLMMVYRDKGVEYRGIMIYVAALYTFWRTARAITGLVKDRHFHSPVQTAAKGISVAAALVSMLELETAMFAQFGGDMAREDRQLMIMLTGGGVSIIVTGIAVGMILRCGKELKKMRNEDDG